MRSTQAKDHPADGPPTGPRLLPVPGSPARPSTYGADGPATGPVPAHPGDGTDHTGPVRPPALHGVGREHPGPDGTLGSPAGTVDADVPAAVGRVLDELLSGRLHHARLVDPLFAEDIAGRVAAFTRHGGKRIRAHLVWWSFRACGGTGPDAASAALRLGAAVELLQTCALVHDDVMDQAVLRRGRPALHTQASAGFAGRTTAERARRAGEAAAILAGDLALAWADDLVAETPLPAPAGAVVRRLWSDMRTEMVAGQYLDLHGQTTGARSLPRALRAACLKSALYSVERPLALGAALAGADDTTLRALSAAGRRVGMAFQLRDDLDDVFADPRHTGKPSGGDIREGKPTYLIALARARAQARDDGTALAVLDRCVGDPALTSRDLTEVRGVLASTGARATVEAKIRRLVAQGLRRFDTARLAPEPARSLRRLLESAATGAAPAPRPAQDPDGTCPAPEAAGSRPASKTAGSRPAPETEGSRPMPDGTRPAPEAAGSRPAPETEGSRPMPDGTRPAPEAAGSRPAPETEGSRPMPDGTRPAPDAPSRRTAPAALRAAQPPPTDDDGTRRAGAVAGEDAR
ncbi:polyprenyl synthetase family protein [Streptomyces thermocoprophilus]